MRLGMDATRISDGKPVILKRLLDEEGPFELEINKLFSTEPLSSNPRNHCAQLLDVIELPNDPPIMVHSLLRPFYNPSLQTYGEFVTFFAQTCEVSPLSPRTTALLNKPGCAIYARKPCRSPVRRQRLCTHSLFPIWTTSGTAHLRTSCLTHRTCVLSLFTPLRLTEVRIFAEKLNCTREPDVQRGTSSSTLAYLVDMILPMGRHWRSHCAVATSRPRSIRT
jgi:hypothetical protein